MWPEKSVEQCSAEICNGRGLSEKPSRARCKANVFRRNVRI